MYMTGLLYSLFKKIGEPGDGANSNLLEQPSYIFDCVRVLFIVVLTMQGNNLVYQVPCTLNYALFTVLY